MKILDKLDHLYETSTALDARKRDFVSPAGYLAIEPDGRIRMSPFGESSPPTTGIDGFQRPGITAGDKDLKFHLSDTAMSQLYDKLAPIHYKSSDTKRKIPAYFLDKLSPSIRAEVINDILMTAPVDKRWMIRAFDDRVRAIVDGDYPRTWNSEVIGITRKIMSDQSDLSGVIMNRDRLNENSTYLRIFWDNTGVDSHGGLRAGIMISNAEDGSGRLMMQPLVWRHACENSIVLHPTLAKDALVSLGHLRGYTAHGMMAQFTDHFVPIFERSAEMIDRMIAAQDEDLPDFNTILQGLQKKHGWSLETTDQVLEGSEGEFNVFGLANGIAYAAKNEDNPDKESSMEQLASKYLYAPKNVWTGLRKVADQVEERDDLEYAFAY